jgi:hypothetical protein
VDLKILLKTVRRVLARTGINAPGDAAVPEFLGSAPPAPVSLERSVNG